MEKNKTFREEFGDIVGEIIEKKYANRDKEGNLLETSYNQMVARFIKVTTKYKNIFKDEEDIKLLEEALLKRRIILGGSIMAGIGTSKLTSLSNCYVIPAVKDSYEGIITADARLAHLMKRRGGVGVDLSNIRPKGSPVNNAANTSTGIVPFMTRYSNTTREVAQGGRRGALMLSIDYRHKDSSDFINAKANNSAILGANISLKVDSEVFLDEHKELLDSAIKNMYYHAEPGILFWDNILDNPIDYIGHPRFKTSSTNPCGEIPLNPYGSCILAHHNLYAYVDKPFTEKALFNLSLLRKDVRVLTMYMNVVVEEELKHIKRIKDISEEGIESSLWTEIERTLRTGRRIGIGKTGLGDMLASLGLPYGPNQVVEKISTLMLDTIYMTSCSIPVEAPLLITSRNFKNFKSHKLIQGIYERNKIDESAVPANIGFVTLAPVGTGSMITDTSSGMEPVFALSYKRKRRAFEYEDDFILDKNGDKWIEFDVYHTPYQKFLEIKKQSGLNIKSPYEGQTANEINPLDKISLQAILQKYTDQSISVTHNVPKTFPIEDVRGLIEEAHAKGLKGFTMYRDGSREGILTTESSEVNAAENGRPKVLPCEIHNVKIDGKSWNVLIGIKNGRPYEIFALMVNNIVIKGITNGYLIKEKIEGVSKYSLNSDFVDIKDLTSYYASGNEQVLTRLLSRSLQNGTKVEQLVSDFDKVSMTIGTFEQVLRRVLLRYVDTSVYKELCPECGKEMAMEGGCKSCKSCGYSKCE